MGEKGTGQYTEIDHKKYRPALLDVIKIDGRWAQVGPASDTIKFLDEKVKGKSNTHIVNWDDYEFNFIFPDKLKIRYQASVQDILNKGMISQEECNVVHWGPEQEEYPYLRGQVSVGGIYKKKEPKNPL